MAKFRIDSIAELSRQMGFTPHETRVAQIDAAEALLSDLDPAKAYPLDFVIFRITGYHPKKVDQSLLTGLALQHDLGLLIEQVSAGLDLSSEQSRQPVLSIDDVTEKFNVTSKTIQRWRRKGLPARRFIFADGKRRVGFLLSSVERFLAAHQEQVVRSANFSQVDELERDDILRRARRLASTCQCCRNEISRRIAHKLNRSPLTILHTIKKHDQENPDEAIFRDGAEPIAVVDRVNILRQFKRGQSLRTIASRLCRPRTAIYRVLLEERIERLAKKKMKFIDDPLYHQDEAESAVAAIVAQDELAPAQTREELRVPRDLPPYLQELYRTPLLSASKERALFLQLNYRKYQFVTARRKLDPQLARARDLNLLDALLTRIVETRNQIVRANLRLVVSVARKHLRPGMNLMELISDGNITLMRAVDGFDPHRGTRFSTYATLALMKGFARSVPRMLKSAAKIVDREWLAEVPDRRITGERFDWISQEQLNSLLSRLNDGERAVVLGHYGIGAAAPATYHELSRTLGLSRHRIREIEESAMIKLRAGGES